MKYVNEALRGMWHEVALGETGSLVVQNIFENCLENDKVSLVPRWHAFYPNTSESVHASRRFLNTSTLSRVASLGIGAFSISGM